MASKITQSTLSKVLLAKKRIAELEAEVKAGEQEILAALQSGANVQDGVLTAFVKEYSRRNIAWKEIVVREKGQEFADRVFNAIKPQTYTSLVIEAVA